MIKIKKHRTAPTVINRQGKCKLAAATTALNKLYDSHQAQYDDGSRKFDFDSSAYGHSSIKEALIKCQNGKCAFCEQNVFSVSHGDIEHFRPKAGYCQNEDDNLHKPGYYWLAYEWNNLLFVCQICNQRYKKNLFPLLNPDCRALNHHDSTKPEKPFFINPANENPRFLISFNKEVAKGLDKRHRGKKTIDAIGLNRKGKIAGVSDLYEIRKDHFERIESIYSLAILPPGPQVSNEKIEKAKKLFRGLRSSRSQFSAMVRDNFPAI